MPRKKSPHDKDAYGDDWAALSKACKQRDNFTCRFCGYNQKTSQGYRYLHADHIIPLTKNGKNKLSNLRTLCQDCHEYRTNLTRPKGLKVHWAKPGNSPAKKKHRISKVKRLRLL